MVEPVEAECRVDCSVLVVGEGGEELGASNFGEQRERVVKEGGGDKVVGVGGR